MFSCFLHTKKHKQFHCVFFLYSLMYAKTKVVSKCSFLPQNNSQGWMNYEEQLPCEWRSQTKGHCLSVNLWWLGHHAESSITTSRRRRRRRRRWKTFSQENSTSASTPRVIPTVHPQCPPLFASQQSLNRWCFAWESSDNHRLATNRLLGNQLTRLDSARCCHHIFLGDAARVQ